MGVTTTGIFGVARKGGSTHSRRPVPRISDGWDSCRRCGGFLVDEHCMELNIEPSQPGYKFWAMRCVQCGDVIDETILRNRYASFHTRHESPSREEGEKYAIYDASSTIRRQTVLRPPPITIR